MSVEVIANATHFHKGHVFSQGSVVLLFLRLVWFFKRSILLFS